MGHDYSAGRRFDREYGVTTQAILFLNDLDPDGAGDAGAHATHYEPVPIVDFHALVQKVPADRIRGATFVDVGAGMGRAVLLASEYDFIQCTGVEVSPGLAEVARENVEVASRARRRCNDVRIVHDDARIWNFPPGDLVVFLYNPFDASALHATLGAIRHRRDPGETWLLYHTPVQRAVLDEYPGWTLIGDESPGAVWHMRSVGA